MRAAYNVARAARRARPGGTLHLHLCEQASRAASKRLNWFSNGCRWQRGCGPDNVWQFYTANPRNRKLQFILRILEAFSFNSKNFIPLSFVATKIFFWGVLTSAKIFAQRVALRAAGQATPGNFFLIVLVLVPANERFN